MKIFSTSFQNLTLEIHNSKILDAYNKNCWFYERAKLSYFTFKNGQETRTQFIAFVTSTCVFRFVYTLPLIRNSEVKFRQFIENFFKNFWRGYYRGRYWRISNTQTDVKRWCHVTFWLCDSNAIFEGKIAQLWVLVKSTIFIAGNCEIVYFKRYIFILCRKNFHFIGTLMTALPIQPIAQYCWFC